MDSVPVHCQPEAVIGLLPPESQLRPCLQQQIPKPPVRACADRVENISN